MNTATTFTSEAGPRKHFAAGGAAFAAATLTSLLVTLTLPNFAIGGKILEMFGGNVPKGGVTPVTMLKIALAPADNAGGDELTKWLQSLAAVVVLCALVGVAWWAVGAFTGARGGVQKLIGAVAIMAGLIAAMSVIA